MRYIVIALAIGAGLFAQDPRQEAVSRVHAISERIARFEDKPAAINLLTHLGRVVCKYDLPAATAVYAQAASELREAGRGPKDHDRIRGIVLHSAARCNPDLAEQLRTLTEPKDKDLARSVDAVLPQAEALLKQDPAQAARIASSILPALPSMDEEQLWDFDLFLRGLRAEDSDQADQLYAEALAQLGARPRWTHLQHMGNYVFGPPGELRSSSSTEVNGMEVFDWAARREGVSDETVKAYLQTVASALWNSETGSNRRSLLAQQLAPHADKVIPQLAPTFREASAEAEVDLSKHFPHTSTEQAFERMAKSPDQRERIWGSMYQYRMHWKEKRFEEAREIAAAIDDLSVRTQLLRLVEIGEGMAAIREEDLTRATGIAARMQPGAHQALLYLGLASAYRKEDLEAAQSMIALVWQITGKVEPVMGSRLLLACAALQAQFEPERALTALAEAVRSFNALQGARRNRGRPRLRVFGSFLIESVRGEDGRFYMMMPLRVEGHQMFHFSDALGQFADLDLDRVDAIIANLRNEEMLAEARIYACELRLKRVFADSQSGNTLPSIAR